MFRIWSILLLSIFISISGSGTVQAEQVENLGIASGAIPSTGGLPWREVYVHRPVDPPLRVGLYPAWGFSIDTNEPNILYYNQSSARLYLAQPFPPGLGNCGERFDWTCWEYDYFSGNDIGRYASYAEWENPSRWRQAYTFYDATRRALAYRLMTCDSSACTNNFGYIRYPILDELSVGLYTSMKFTSSGVPYVAYYMSYAGGDDYLIVAHITFDWSGNCGEDDSEGLWQCDMVDTGNGVGQYASLDISWDDQVSVAYYTDGSGDLKYAEEVGLGGNCVTGSHWDCVTIDGTSGANVGLYAALSAPVSAEDTLDIAYYDSMSGMLKYAYPRTGGNCGGGAWQCLYVDEMGNSLEPMGLSMDGDLSGNPIIAYQRIASPDSSPSLRIARPYWTIKDVTTGNCGEIPPGSSDQIFHCSTLDAGNQYADEGDYIAIHVSQSNLVGIAYSEDLVDEPITSLKYLSQQYQSFLPNLYKP